MLVRSSFEVQHIHAVFASFSGKSLFRGLGLPGGLPARIQSYPRNSGFQGPGIAVPAGLGGLPEAVSRVPWNPQNSGFQAPQNSAFWGFQDSWF
jgi:hypothetical protein